MTLVVGLAVGFFVGGDDRAQNMRIGALVAVLIGLVVLIDRFMQSFPGYMFDMNGRPIATVGSMTRATTPATCGGRVSTSSSTCSCRRSRF